MESYRKSSRVDELFRDLNYMILVFKLITVMLYIWMAKHVEDRIHNRKTVNLFGGKKHKLISGTLAKNIKYNGQGVRLLS
jgi:hypothetical protein